MATGYTVVTQYPTLEFLGGTQTREVMAVGYNLLPSGTYVEHRFPKSTYSTSEVATGGEFLSKLIANLFTITGVIGVEWVQIPTSGGELQDAFTITVASTSGDSTGQVTITYANIFEESQVEKISALHKTLNDTEAL